MILTKDKILEEIKAGNIKIEPFDKSRVGPGSVDLRIDDEFRTFKKVEEVVHIDNQTDHTKYTEVKNVDDYLLIMPGETVQGITKEKITLAPNICGWLEGRSRFARMGLLIHISASFIQPGVSNRQVLEISNMSGMPLAIYPGTAVCQVIFQRTEGEAQYKGRFSKQDSV